MRGRRCGAGWRIWWCRSEASGRIWRFRVRVGLCACWTKRKGHNVQLVVPELIAEEVRWVPGLVKAVGICLFGRVGTSNYCMARVSMDQFPVAGHTSGVILASGGHHDVRKSSRLLRQVGGNSVLKVMSLSFVTIAK
jgi:hypothetical protein